MIGHDLRKCPHCGAETLYVFDESFSTYEPIEIQRNCNCHKKIKTQKITKKIWTKLDKVNREFSPRKRGDL